MSSAIAFSTTDNVEGLDKFIMIVITFGRLYLCNSGILHGLKDSKLFWDSEKLPKLMPPPNMVQSQEGNQLEFRGNKTTKPFTLTYGKVISHNPLLARWAMAVLHTTSQKWKNLNLVVKISWPSSGRALEDKLVDQAITRAKGAVIDRWAINHLPQVLFAQDVAFESDSTNEKVARLFYNAKFINGEYKYEWYTLQIIIQEQLYLLKTLTSAKESDRSCLILDVVYDLILSLDLMHSHRPSSSVVLRLGRNFAPGPESEQYHVSDCPEEAQRESRQGESVWSSD